MSLTSMTMLVRMATLTFQIVLNFFHPLLSLFPKDFSLDIDLLDDLLLLFKMSLHEFLDFVCCFVHFVAVHLGFNIMHDLRLDVSDVVVLVFIIDVMAI